MLKSVYINRSLDKKVEIIVQVDDIVHVEEGKLKGYWINNKTTEGLLNLTLTLSLNNKGKRLSTVVAKDLTKEFLGDFDEYIKEYFPQGATGNSKKVPFFYRLYVGGESLPSRGGETWDYPSNNGTIDEIKVDFNQSNIREVPGYEDFSSPMDYFETTGQPKNFNSLKNANMLLKEDNDFLTSLVNNLGNTVELENQKEFQDPVIKLEDCFGNLHTTINPSGQTVGFFAANIDKIFELVNPYEKLLDNISPQKKEDILNGLKQDENFIKSITAERVRLNRSGEVFDSEKPPTPVATPQRIEGMSINAPSGMVYYSFVDVGTTSLPEGEYEYSIKLTSDATTYIKNKFRKDIIDLTNSIRQIENFENMLHAICYNSIIGRYRGFAAPLFNLYRNTIYRNLVTIFSVLSGYSKSNMSTDKIIEDINSALNVFDPRKAKPEYLLNFINSVKSRTADVENLFRLNKLLSGDDDLSAGSLKSSTQLSEYLYTFKEKVAIDRLNYGLEYFNKSENSEMLSLNRGEYDSRISLEKSRYNAGDSQSSSTFWDPSTSHTFLTPAVFRDKKNNKHNIGELTSPSSQQLTKLLENRKLFENLKIMKIVKEIKEGNSFNHDLTSYLEDVFLSNGVSFNGGRAIPMSTDGTSQINKSQPKTPQEMLLSRFGVLNLKGTIQGTTSSPFGFGLSNGVLTGLKGGQVEVNSSFSFKNIPQHFRYQVIRDDRIIIDPPTFFSKCESTFSSGLGSMFYYLTYDQIRRVEFLSSIPLSLSYKAESWKNLTYEQLSSFSGKMLCRVVEHTDNNIEFKTNTDSKVINSYFLITSEGTLNAGVQEEVQLEGDDIFYILNDDGTISIAYDADDDQITTARNLETVAGQQLSRLNNKATTVLNLVEESRAIIQNFPNDPNSQDLEQKANTLWNSVKTLIPTNVAMKKADATATRQSIPPLVEKVKNYTNPDETNVENTVNNLVQQIKQKYQSVLGFVSTMGSYETQMTLVKGSLQTYATQATQKIQDDRAQAAADAQAAEDAAAAAEAERQRQEEEDRRRQMEENLAPDPTEINQAGRGEGVSGLQRDSEPAPDPTEINQAPRSEGYSGPQRDSEPAPDPVQTNQAGRGSGTSGMGQTEQDTIVIDSGVIGNIGGAFFGIL